MVVVVKGLIQMIRGYLGDGAGGDGAGGDGAGSAQNRFTLLNNLRLLLLAVGMAALWYLSAPSVLNSEEELLWERVRSAQLHLSQWRQQNGTATPLEEDPWQCGMIGLEWSGVTTTLGELSSKRTACNPAWAIQYKRWFNELDLKPGDPIAIYSSASFPALLLNALAAAEEMQLQPLLIVSLGASTWGANHPDNLWPAQGAELRRGGFIRKKADYYTLGAGSELARGLSPEGVMLLRQAAKNADVELLMADGLEDMVSLKSKLLDDYQARVFISIGGSQANLGASEDVLKLQTGLVPASEVAIAGNGVIGFAMQKGIPVIHMLNIKSISDRVGIPYDSKPRKMGPARVGVGWSLVGLVLFFIVLFTHRRWRLEAPEE
jgi:poly-gamma-glutamate system protein